MTPPTNPGPSPPPTPTPTAGPIRDRDEGVNRELVDAEATLSEGRDRDTPEGDKPSEPDEEDENLFGELPQACADYSCDTRPAAPTAPTGSPGENKEEAEEARENEDTEPKSSVGKGNIHSATDPLHEDVPPEVPHLGMCIPI